jgi:type IV secretion system protein VirD4
MRYQEILFVLLIMALAVLAVVVHGAKHHAHLPRNRERHLRMRLHLRRRPGRGHATGFQLWWHFGRWASYRKSGQTRPSLSRAVRRGYPDEHSIWLGRAHHRRGLRLPVQEHVLIFAPPRTGKTQLLSRLIVHYPGPALVTSTKPDVFLDTSGLRLLGGPIAVLNPQMIGGAQAASTVRWSPIEGCRDRAVAIRRADGFANAVHGTGGDKENVIFRNAARAYLRAMFHAAALARGDMRLVARWALTATKGGAVEAEAILQAAGAGDWADELAQLHGAAERTNATNEMVMTQVMGFMADPQMARAALPGPGAIDLPRFLEDNGTLYLIADPEGNEESPLSPYFAALASEYRFVASMIGQASPSRRLDPPLGLFMDEATQICRCPIPSWLADSGGKGIQIFTVVHGRAQLAEAWGQFGSRIILDTSGCKVALPGIDDPDTLEMLSTICGEHSYRVHETQGWHQHPRLTPSMINQLPDGFALIKRGNCPPVIAKLAAARRDRRVKRAKREGWATAPVRAAMLLAEPAGTAPAADPRRQPVALPAAPAEQEPAMSGGREMADAMPAPTADGRRRAYPWGGRGD